MTIYTVFDAHKVPDGRRERLGREAADGRRGPLRPRPGLVWGSCGARVRRRPRLPPRADRSSYRAPWDACIGLKQLIST